MAVADNNSIIVPAWETHPSLYAMHRVIYRSYRHCNKVCKLLLAQGKPPKAVISIDGHIEGN